MNFFSDHDTEDIQLAGPTMNSSNVILGKVRLENIDVWGHLCLEILPLYRARATERIIGTFNQRTKRKQGKSH